MHTRVCVYRAPRLMCDRGRGGASVDAVVAADDAAVFSYHPDHRYHSITILKMGGANSGFIVLIKQ